MTIYCSYQASHESITNNSGITLSQIEQTNQLYTLSNIHKVPINSNTTLTSTLILDKKPANNSANMNKVKAKNTYIIN